MTFYTSLSGLKAAQTDLATISNNVANVGTLGFKKSRTEFGDLVSSAPLQAVGSIAGQGTRLKGITQQFTQGAFESSERSLDLAVAGQGFFVTRVGSTGGQVAFTRNGSFGVTADRYVTDSSGGYLQVLPVDDEGRVTASGLSSTRALQLPLSTGEPKPTTKIDIAVTLPENSALPADHPKFAGGTYAFNRFDPDTYNQSTATTVFDPSGAALPATMYFTRLTEEAGTPPTTEWEVRLFVGNSETPAVVGGTAGPLTLTFDEQGQLTAPQNEVTFGDGTGPLTADIKFGLTTKMANSTFALTSLTQDGFANGKLDNVTVSPEGLVVASFSNGTTQNLGKLVLATFANPAGLRQMGDAHWAVTGASGEATIGEANTDGYGAINAGSLERSNVDITEELVALIGAQRNFQANAKAIETATTLTQTIVNLRT